MGNPRRVAVFLVGYDGSQSARRAAEYALRMAAGRDAQLVFLYVHNTTVSTLAPMTGSGLNETVDQSNAEIQTEVEALTKGTEVPWELDCLQGNPFHLLIDTAEQRGAEAIVLGTTRRTGLHLSGSLAVNLVKHARWPVVVVP